MPPNINMCYFPSRIVSNRTNRAKPSFETIKHQPFGDIDDVEEN